MPSKRATQTLPSYNLFSSAPVPSALNPPPSSFILHPSSFSSAFTLLELLAVIAVVSVLAAVSVPVYQRTTQASRAATCVSNLRQLGAALNLYLGEHAMTMPPLKAGRQDRSEDLPVIDNTLNAYAPNDRVFACPSDAAGLAARSGTSYFWNVALSSQPITSLNFFRHTDRTAIPVLSDKSAFHPYTESKVNILYADGHADKDLTFVANPP